MRVIMGEEPIVRGIDPVRQYFLADSASAATPTRNSVFINLPPGAVAGQVARRSRSFFLRRHANGCPPPGQLRRMVKDTAREDVLSRSARPRGMAAFRTRGLPRRHLAVPLRQQCRTTVPQSEKGLKETP